jgi:hypothetical protein
VSTCQRSVPVGTLFLSCRKFLLGCLAVTNHEKASQCLCIGCRCLNNIVVIYFILLNLHLQYIYIFCRSRSNRSFVNRFADVSMSLSNSHYQNSSDDEEGKQQHRYMSDHDHCDKGHRSSSKASHTSSHCSLASRYSSTSTLASSSSSHSSRTNLDYFSRSMEANRGRSRSRESRETYHHPKRQQNVTGRSQFLDYRSDSRCSFISSSSPRHHSDYSHHEEYLSRNRSQYSRTTSFELLPMAYWERSPGCREAKLDHMERMDHFCDDDREYLILQTSLWERNITLETNMFPYDTPPGVEHWTLWCREEMTHAEVCEYVESWLRKHMPRVRRWNYDSNSGERSIDLFHVHVYIETIPYSYHYRPPSPPLATALSGQHNSIVSDDDGEEEGNPDHLIAVGGGLQSMSDNSSSDGENSRNNKK